MQTRRKKLCCYFSVSHVFVPGFAVNVCSLHSFHKFVIPLGLWITWVMAYARRRMYYEMSEKVWWITKYLVGSSLCEVCDVF